MSSDDSLVGALERVVAAEPANGALRLHLAQVLAGEGRDADALEHCRIVLTGNPADLTALDLAARAARAVGDDTAADGYDRIRRALGDGDGPPRSAPPEGRVAPPLTTAGDGDEPSSPAVEAELEAFLANVLNDSVDTEQPAITLADVGGLGEVKAQLQRSFIGPLQNPELRRMYGKSLRGGLVMYGPPGCGKTFLARAVAGELGAQFYAVGLHEVLEMWIGSSERNVHEVFQTARRNAPCVLFLDELDALGQSRARLAHHGAMRNVVVQLLSELDGLGADNEGVFVLAATNQPWDLDPALRRPGRFDRTVLVLPPDEPARAAILRYHLRDRPTDAIDVDKLAARSDGFSGADLRLLCEDAAERALDDSLRTGRPRPINRADTEAALRRIKPSATAWFDVARNFVTFANQNGEYDELAVYLRRRKLL